MTFGDSKRVRRPPAALVQAICHDLDDDQAWQVFADWLTEQGDPRGELVMVERAVPRAEESAQAALRERARAIVAQHASKWKVPLPTPPQTRFERRHGFVVSVRLRPWDAARQSFLAKLLDHPAGVLLRSLEIGHVPLGDRGLKVLLRTPELARFKELHLRGAQLTAASAVHLGNSPTLHGLTVLDLSHNRIGPEGAEVLATAPNGWSLERLDLGGNHIGDDGLAALASAPWAPRLRVLDLTRNQLGPAGIAAGARAFRSVRSLSIVENPIFDEGLAAIAQAASKADLTELRACRCSVSAQGARALAASPALRGLRILHLSFNALGPRGVGALASSEGIAAVRSLNLNRNDVQCAGALTLGASVHLSALRDLYLDDNGIRSEGAIGLAHARSLHGLRNLNLFGNPIGASGSDALRASTVLRRCRIFR